MKSLLKLLGVLSPVHIQWFHAFHEKTHIGTDEFGNEYYEGKPRKGYVLPRRWVMYKGEPEASSVPPEWHGWLHHQTNQAPSEVGKSHRRSWQAPYKPNMTGTNQAYRPPGHTLAEGQREKATGDYEPWVPGQSVIENKG